jgi:hypothetical protein
MEKLKFITKKKIMQPSSTNSISSATKTTSSTGKKTWKEPKLREIHINGGPNASANENAFLYDFYTS